MRRFFDFLKTTLKETDFIMLLMCIFASVYGSVMVFSATRGDIPEGGVISRDARIMILAVIIGIVMSVIISFIDYNFITKMFPAIGLVCIALMVATLIWGVGPNARQDAKTWLVMGSTGLYFQSSELLKIGFIITFGMHLELVQDKLTKPLHVIFLCLHAAVTIGLVVISGDMGSALVFVIIFIVMIFCAGIQWRYIITGAAALCAAVPVLWYYVLGSTQKDRVLGLIYPERYEDIMYQQQKGITAIGSGGITGQGLFKGIYTQAGVVPENENDMIFTCIGEELGLVGCIAALLLLFGIVFRAIYNGKKSKYNATALMCYGFAAMVAGQTIINISMCLMVFPVVGITLPFFSAGGSSNLCIYIGVGLMLSIYRFDKEREATNFSISPYESRYRKRF